jgi:hypothetical protein
MTAEPLIRELFRALQATIHERLSLVENILNTIEKPKIPLYDHEFIRRIERLEQQMSFLQSTPMQMPSPLASEGLFEKEILEERMNALEEQLATTCAQVEALERKPSALEMKPSAKPAAVVEPVPSVILVREEDIAEPLEEEVVEEEEVVIEEEEVVEEEEEEEGDGEALELEEFPYKGRTFYKDSSENIYRTDDEGEVIQEPVGIWNGKKIVWS